MGMVALALTLGLQSHAWAIFIGGHNGLLDAAVNDGFVGGLNFAASLGTAEQLEAGVDGEEVDAIRVANTAANQNLYFELLSDTALGVPNMGYRLSSRVRINGPGAPSNAQSFAFGTSSNFYSVALGADGQGNLQVSVTGAGFALSAPITTDAVATDYNFVELISSDGGPADLLVNGAVVASGFAGAGGSAGFITNRLFFGDGDPGGNGSADYAFLQLDVGENDLGTLVPEPASLAMLALGSVLMLPRRKRA